MMSKPGTSAWDGALKAGLVFVAAALAAMWPPGPAAAGDVPDASNRYDLPIHLTPPLGIWTE